MFELHHGDCLDVMKTFPDESFDLVITSPPYNIHNTTGGGFSRNVWDSSLWKGPAIADAYDGTEDALPRPVYVEWQKAVLNESYRLLKPTGAIYYNHKPRVQAGIYEMPLELNPGLPLRQIVIWRKSGGINFSPTFYQPWTEWIMIFAKPGFRLKSKGASGMGDVWDFVVERRNPHPASFPVELPERILQTAPAQRVLDPFMGSGTTGVACIRHGVDFVGIEKSKRYLDMARFRLERAQDPEWYTYFDDDCIQVKEPAQQLVFSDD